MTNPFLELKNVSRSYGYAESKVYAIWNVSLTIMAGEFVGIIGPSGSGKSTMLNLMGLLDRPNVGTIQLGGQDVSTLPDRDLSALRARHLGFVFQQFFLLDGRSAIDNVCDALLYSGVRRRARRPKAQEALDRVGMAHRFDHRPSQLSGGECQRVAIARALVNEPEVVLADEPTGNLDSLAGETVLRLFTELHSSGSTIVLITHDRTIAETLPRVVSMHDGLIEFDSGHESHLARSLELGVPRVVKE